VKVTTELGFAAGQQFGNQLLPYVDSEMINIYPFYGQVTIGNSISNLVGAYNTFNQQFKGKPVVIGETGWPSAGATNGNAVPSVANEQTFTQGVYQNSNQIGTTFLFSAFDEPWLSTQNSWGPNWGLYTSAGTPKFSFSTIKKAKGGIGPVNKKNPVTIP